MRIVVLLWWLIMRLKMKTVRGFLCKINLKTDFLPKLQNFYPIMTTRVPVQDCIFRSMAEMIAQYFHYGNNLLYCIVLLSLLVCNLGLKLQLSRRVQLSDHLHIHFDYIRYHLGCHLLCVLGTSDQVFLSLWIVHAMKCSWSHEWPIHWLTFCVFRCLLGEPGCFDDRK